MTYSTLPTCTLTWLDLFPWSLSHAVLFQVDFLERIGKKHLDYEFFRILSLRCSYTIFNVELVQSILEDILSSQSRGDKRVEHSAELILVSAFFSFYWSNQLSWCCPLCNFFLDDIIFLQFILFSGINSDCLQFDIFLLCYYSVKYQLYHEIFANLSNFPILWIIGSFFLRSLHFAISWFKERRKIKLFFLGHVVGL